VEMCSSVEPKSMEQNSVRVLTIERSSFSMVVELRRAGVSLQE